MKDVLFALFAPTISFWQWLVMSAGLAVAFWIGSGWGILAWLGIMIVGAAVEGFHQAMVKS